MTEFLTKWIGDTVAYVLILCAVVVILVGMVGLLASIAVGIAWLVTHTGWIATIGILVVIVCSILGFFSARHDLDRIKY